MWPIIKKKFNKSWLPCIEYSKDFKSIIMNMFKE